MQSSRARVVLNQAGGKFVTVIFTKKDGSRRVLNGRLGVTKYLSGGESKLDKEKFIIIYDVHAKGYRAVNVNSIQEIHAQYGVFK